MAGFCLCSWCASRFPKSHAISISGESSRCFLCQGIFSQLEALCSKAVGLSEGLEWESFSVSTHIPPQVLVREEEVATYFAPGEFTSIKNSLNSSAAGLISKMAGRQNRQRFPDLAIELDFEKGSARAIPSPLFVFGRYLKLSRRHCQSRWQCSKCSGKGCRSCAGSGQSYPSVEEEIGSEARRLFLAEDAILHASGREDVDVRALGSGRPFVLELKKPKKRKADLLELEKAIEKKGSVRAVGLRIVGPHFVDAVCNSHFDKEYSALVSADRPLGQKDAEKASSLSGAVLFQQTPNRVLGRRADLERRRRIFSVSAQCEKDGKLRLHIFAEAGAYIKEFITSDNGRTKPSIAQALSCNARCEELDVVKIHDYFLETI
ncbi:MAG: tRNA pseudouridine(54/55) synthase Pus10 [Candidatus Micrarchaeota archaeon]|nr:tRNA pseudouridine(54/55) synthase Pus10 [Candidatus Micrarchaeota archaeon]